MEAELIHILHKGGLSLDVADRYPLWVNAAALGMHRIETFEEHDQREVVEKQAEYWEETQAQRMEKLAGYTEARRARQRERKQRKVT